MIISHKFKFIFIKTAKTAGTSIEIFLSQHCGVDDVITPIFPQVEPHVARNYSEAGFRNHMPAMEVRSLVSENVWNEYFKFCVERNPWDKTLSHYHMKNYREGGDLTLEEYFSKGKFCVNFGRYTDESGRIILDKVIRYENLNDELGAVFNQLGIPFSGVLDIRAKSEYRQDRKHYRDILTIDQANLVADKFSREIKMHGYVY